MIPHERKTVLAWSRLGFIGPVMVVVFLSFVPLLHPVWAVSSLESVGGGVKQAVPTPTFTPTARWVGQIASRAVNMELAGTVLRVSVEGLKGLPVKVYSQDDWKAIGYTGTKPEYGEYVVEFAPLSKGYYTIEPEGLGATVTFYSDARSYIFVKFIREEEVEPTPTPPDPIPAPITPTATPQPTATSQPVPTPAPPPTARPQPTTPPGPAPTVIPTPPSVTPTAIVVTTGTPPPLSRPGWQGRIVRQEEGPFYAALAVSIPGFKDVAVDIKSDGWGARAFTGTKPEYGDFACEFGGLSPGTYTVVPQGLGTSMQVRFGVGGFALMEFTSYPILTLPPSPSPEQESGPTMVPPSPPAEATATAARPLPPAPPPTATATPLVLPPAPTPEPSLAWFGRIVQQVSGKEKGIRASTIAVRIAGPKNVPVELKIDGYSTVALTGTKQEYGDSACEFGGLSEGTYTVIPHGLGASLDVAVEQGDFALVEFVYQPLAPPRPSPAPLPAGGWSGRVLLNTSQQGASGCSSVIIVRVLGVQGLPVEIWAGGLNATALTGTKPEYGPFACGFADLLPGTYQIVPQGLGTSAQVTMDGLGLAVVEFTPDD